MDLDSAPSGAAAPSGVPFDIGHLQAARLSPVPEKMTASTAPTAVVARADDASGTQHVRVARAVAGRAESTRLGGDDHERPDNQEAGGTAAAGCPMRDAGVVPKLSIGSKSLSSQPSDHATLGSNRNTLDERQEPSTGADSEEQEREQETEDVDRSFPQSARAEGGILKEGEGGSSTAGPTTGGPASDAVAAALEAPRPVVELYGSMPGCPDSWTSGEQLQSEDRMTAAQQQQQEEEEEEEREYDGHVESSTSRDHPTHEAGWTRTEAGAAGAREEGSAMKEDKEGFDPPDSVTTVEDDGDDDSDAADSPGDVHARRCCDVAAGPPSAAAPAAPGSLSQLVLKFTTVAGGNDAPSFSIDRNGATVGRGSANDISIPTDSCMGESDHASIVWREGAFHVQDRGQPYGASIRIATGRGLRGWLLERGSMFSAGNSVFHTKEIDEEKGMLLEIVAGPLKGEQRRVDRNGATVGRATENAISIADPELSRHHSTVECEDTQQIVGARASSEAIEASDACNQSSDSCSTESGLAAAGSTGSGNNGDDDGMADADADLSSCSSSSGRSRRGRLEFYLCDVGSTNGTYVQLVGPYASSRRLELSDQILIGRTGFSINRFDWGVWEDRGSRRAMEDKTVVVQDMGVESLASLGLGPQTFVAVYDGHGGSEASHFLWQHLHVAVANALDEAAPRISAALRHDRAAEREAVFGSGGGGEAMRCADRDGDGDSSSSCKGVWGVSHPAAAFSSGASACAEKEAGSGAPPPVPPTQTQTQTPQMLSSSNPPARTATNPGAAHEGAGGCSAGDLSEGASSSSFASRKEPWWGAYRAQPAAAVGVKPGGGGGSRSSRGAPSLPAEWFSGMKSTANDVSETTTEDQESASPNPGGAGAERQRWDEEGAACSAVGGDAGSRLDPPSCNGSAGVQAGDSSGSRNCSVAVDRSARQDGGAERLADGGDVSPQRSGVQSPGGGPSRPLPSAGLPAEGGGYGARRGVNAFHERRAVLSETDKVIEKVVCQSFLATDEAFLTTASKPSCGSTATTAMILGDRFYSFNVGDSRTILCRSGRAEVVTKDHKPNCADEAERIKRAGGMVIHKRVMGELAVSRAFGDRAFKMGIKALLREDEEARKRELADEIDEEEEADGIGTETHLRYPDGGSGQDSQDDSGNGSGSRGETQGDEEAEDEVEPSTADRNGLTMSRGSLGGSGNQLLPPVVAAPPAPSATASASPAPPPPPAASPPKPPSLAEAAPSQPQPSPERPAAQAPRAPVTDPEHALIIAKPEMVSRKITPEDDFLLLACDGLFDVYSSDEVVQIVQEEMRAHGDTQRVCEALTRKAIDERYTRDNVSVALVVLNKFW